MVHNVVCILLDYLKFISFLFKDAQCHSAAGNHVNQVSDLETGFCGPVLTDSLSVLLCIVFFIYFSLCHSVSLCLCWTSFLLSFHMSICCLFFEDQINASSIINPSWTPTTSDLFLILKDTPCSNCIYWIFPEDSPLMTLFKF